MTPEAQQVLDVITDLDKNLSRVSDIAKTLVSSEHGLKAELELEAVIAMIYGAQRILSEAANAYAEEVKAEPVAPVEAPVEAPLEPVADPAEVIAA